MNLSATQDSTTRTARVTEPADSTARARAEHSGSRRQIGPLGTLARIAGGALAIALPIALDGLTAFETAIALIALPLIAAIAAPLITWTFRRLAPNALGSRHAICFAPACSLIVVMVVANSALVAPTSANGNVTIWMWQHAAPRRKRAPAGNPSRGGAEERAHTSAARRATTVQFAMARSAAKQSRANPSC